jgi:arylsulfatase A-like enzyme
MKTNISRKQALRRLGGLALGSMVFPRGSQSASAHPSGEKKQSKPLKKQDRPHIILIMTDQHRGDAIGAAGNPAVVTPHLDALAAEGALFSHAYSSAPSCTPARSCLLTGMNPWHHGLLGYGRVARRYTYELPRMLREAGYYTFGIGKNHWFPQKALHGFHGTLVDESGRIEQDGFVSDYRDWFRFQAPGEDPDKTGLGWNSHLARPYALDERLHPTSWTGQTAVDFLDHYQADAPLFLKVSFERPHSPYDPPQSYVDLYSDVRIPPPVTGDWEGEIYNEGKGETTAEEKEDIPTSGPPAASFADFGTAQAVKTKKFYYANITFIDRQVGRIVAKLKERGMYDHAIICFTADHGDAMGDHYHWRKTYPYEGSARIPFIVRWPEKYAVTAQRGSVMEAPVGLQDFLPTFLKAAGRDIPKDMDGGDLMDVLNGRDGWREYIGLEHAATYWKNNYWAAVTDGRVKYIWYFRTGREQFFDLAGDPHETTDLANAADRDAQVKLWRGRLVDYLKERGAGFVRDGRPVRRTKSMLYSPHYPHNDESDSQWLNYWVGQETRSFTLAGGDKP